MPTISFVTPASRRALLSTLNRCVAAASDAQKGYAIAAADAHAPELKSLFQHRSDERAAFVVALESAIAELGGTPTGHGTIQGTLHRTWLEARAFVAGAPDRAILVECERGERGGLPVFEIALWLTRTSPDAPQGLRETIGAQVASIRDALDDLATRYARPA